MRVEEAGGWLRVWVELPGREYPIYVGEGLLSHVGGIASELLPEGKIFVVTTETVRRLYGEPVEESLSEFFEVHVLEAPEGEEAKSWETLGELYGRLIELGVERSSTIASLGGGAVGDLAGFAAATVLRGVNLIHIPTTLLAQVDSSIGGKTAINHPLGKNLIGTFYQPRLVVSDVETLKTLPPEEIRSGLAEVAKYGVIADRGLLELLSSEADGLLDADPEVVGEVVVRCSSIKASVVERDEYDTRGVRAWLNYGHTVGHALEAVEGFSLRHGEAVSVGMVAEAHVSVSLGLMSRPDLEKLTEILGGLGLPVRWSGVDVRDVLEAMRRDKKVLQGRIRVTLPTGLGVNPVLREVSEKLLKECLREVLG